MHVYITTGTYDFLKNIKETSSQEKMALMQNEDGALLLHETNGETVFKEPRKYELLDTKGNIGETGFVVMNNIPVTDEGRPIFEFRFKNRSKLVENEPGFLAIRVLRPLASNTYIVMTVWEAEEAFNNWKNSASYQEAQLLEKSTEPQSKIFAGFSYIRKYLLSETPKESV